MPVIRRLISAWFGLLVSLLLAVGVVAGPTAARASKRPASSATVPVRDVGPEYCDGCHPPLRYSGGPVLNTLGRQGLTVTPIYWAPRGSANQLPGNYEAVINGYIANVAAASGANTNVFSIDTEYYDIFGGQLSHIRYHITAGPPVVDTRPLPKNGCRPARPTYNACLVDGQLQAELSAVLTARHLPRGLASFYPLFFPPGVETDDGTGSTSGSDFCAYHADAGAGARLIVYGNEPYSELNGCTSGQSPNHNAAADSSIDDLSHELNEATTDPTYEPGTSAWQDQASTYEIGDICSYYYGAPLGSTDPASPQTTEYNQVINGGHYYTQTEFSNYAYHRLGVGLGCQPSESSARGPAPSGGSVTHIYSNLSPNTLPANGRGTSSLFVQVWDNSGADIPGDRISFSTYVLSGQGRCGSVRPHAAETDGAGTVDVTYRASRSNVACVIVATDAMGGRSVSSVIYQGRTRSIAPGASQRFPRLVTAGRRSTFTTSFRNPTRRPIADAQPQFAIFAPGTSSPNVRARQIHLSVSRHGGRGPFVPVVLSGSTDGAGIIGVIGGATGFSFRGRHTLTLTYRIRVSKSVPRRRRNPILQFEVFLDQVNPGSGADNVLADTGTRNAKVR